MHKIVSKSWPRLKAISVPKRFKVEYELIYFLNYGCVVSHIKIITSNKEIMHRYH